MTNFISQNLIWFVLFAVIASAISLFLNIILLWRSQSFKSKNKTMLSAQNAKDIEAMLVKQAENLKDIDKEIQELFEMSNRINKTALQSLHKIGIIRYNPFRDIGGDQSFAVALLDGKNSGLVISSLHTREGTRVYAKPIVKSESRYPLTEEEKQAIKIAEPIKESRI